MDWSDIGRSIAAVAPTIAGAIGGIAGNLVLPGAGGIAGNVLASRAVTAILDALGISPDLPEADKQAVEEKIKALKEVKDKDDTEAIKKAMDALSDAVQKVGAAMYQGSQPGSQPETGAPQGDGGSKSGTDKGPVDAEYKEVK